MLSYRGHLLTENRNGLVVSTMTSRAYGSAERDAALLMAESLPGTYRVTLGGDKGYDAHDFIAELRHMEITPHIAQNDTNRRSAVDERATRHTGYQLSQKKRKRIEEVCPYFELSRRPRTGTGPLNACSKSLATHYQCHVQ